MTASRLNGQKGGWPKGKKRKAHETGVEKMRARIHAAVEYAKKLRRSEAELLKRGLEDVKAGRVKPLDQIRAELGKPRKGKKGKQ